MGSIVGDVMGKGQEEAPATPDYTKSAIATANSNKFNTSGPYGTGTWTLRPGADPNNPQAGDWMQTTTLSNGQQSLYDQGVKNKLAAALAGYSMIGDLGDQKTTADALYSKATQYMGQQFGDQQAALETQLQNQGLTQGSDAYEKAMRNFMQTRNQAYEGAASNAIINADTAQNNAVSRLASILASTKETAPTSAGLGGGVDLAGAQQAQYQADLDRVNAKSAQNQQNLQNLVTGGLGAYALGTGGLSGLASIAPMLEFSDRRLKSNISLIGVRGGLPLYEYDIMGKRERGFMADEVALVAPDAVHEHPSGYLMVDYSKVGGRP